MAAVGAAAAGAGAGASGSFGTILCRNNSTFSRERKRDYASQAGNNYLFTLKDTEWTGGRDSRFVGACGPNDSNRCIVHVELLVLLESLTQSVKPVPNEIFQRA